MGAPQGSPHASERATPTRRPGRSGPPARLPGEHASRNIAEATRGRTTGLQGRPELELVARTDAVNEALAHYDPRAADEYRSAAATLRRQPKQHLHPKAMH